MINLLTHTAKFEVNGIVKRIVLALGGNALGHTPQEQLALVKKTAGAIADLVEDGYEIVIGHGNGPQIGAVQLAMDFAAAHGAKTPYMPLPECGAMSQGYIGYHLQQAIAFQLQSRGIAGHAVSVITQVAVDKNDRAFQTPAKPIGMFYTRQEAQRMEKEQGFVFMEDAGRGYRRVVASPEPVSIVELPVIKQLVDLKNIVITVGGGGIPVIETEHGYRGIAAVIDKDKSCARLARDLKADMLMILTAVEKVCIHYKRENQQELDSMTVPQAKAYIEQGHFAPGSMLPKVEACLSFVEQTANGVAVITSLDCAKEALLGKTGTKITKA